MVGDDGEKALDVLWQVAQDATAKPSERVQAAEALLNRGFGRPTSPVELSGAEGGPLVVEVVTYQDGKDDT